MKPVSHSQSGTNSAIYMRQTSNNRESRVSANLTTLSDMADGNSNILPEFLPGSSPPLQNLYILQKTI